MKTRVCISFWRVNYLTNLLTGKAPIYCRIIVAGKRAEIATGHALGATAWDSRAGKAVGITPAATHINRMLTKLRDQLNDIHADLERRNKPVAAARIKQLYKTLGATPLSLLALYDAFLMEREGLVDLEIAPRTQLGAKTRRKHLEQFLTLHKLLDLRPEEFTFSVADKCLHWLLVVKGYERNTAVKTLKAISQVLRWGMRREYLDKNPMELYEYKLAAPKDITYLEAEELEALSTYSYAVDSLGMARDFFVLQCWTGLAYADLAALDIASCVETSNGRRILRVRRAKSTVFQGYECVIPLLPEAERILAHYQDKPPVFSNQYYNRALKQAVMLCGINKEVSSHIGRKTAGVLLLNTGIPMEVVSKILGHSSVRMTERVYAKILDRTVVDAIDKAFGALPAPGFEPEPEGIEEEPRVIQFRFGA